MQHGNGCSNGRVNVAADPGNWVAENLNIGQVNNLIRQAQARLSNPPAHPPVSAFIARPPNMEAPTNPIPFGGGLFNLFGFGGGDGDARLPNTPH